LRLPLLVEAPVYGWERLVLLKHLLDHGLSKSAIARQLGVSRRSIHHWITTGQLVGPPGVGKTHLAISLAIAAAQSGRRVYYGTLADLITSLEEAQQAGQLAHRLKTLVFPSLLVVDEIGYLPISRTGAMLFFQLMSRRYETGATVLTSNKGFEEWGEVFGDDVMAGALIDRLVHHCHIVNIRGNSYRMRQHAELYGVLRRRGQPAEPPPLKRRPRAREAATP